MSAGHSRQPWTARIRWAVPAAAIVLAALFVPLLAGQVGLPGAAALVAAAPQALLLATVATSWNMVGGYLGRIDLGHVAYFGIGAYGTGIAMAVWGWGLPAALASATVLASVTALVVGRAVLRLTGATFAIASIGILVGIRELARIAGPMTGGGRGLTLPPLRPGALYYGAVGLFVVAVLLSWWLRHTRAWPVLVAIRDDEAAAQVRGLPAMAWQLAVLTGAAAVTGAAGGLWAYQSAFIDPDLAFAESQVFDMVTASMLGGLGTLAGPLIGAAVLFTGHVLLWLPTDPYLVLVQGGVLIAVVRWLPWGIVGVITSRRGPLTARRSPTEQGRDVEAVPSAPLPSGPPGSPGGPGGYHGPGGYAFEARGLRLQVAGTMILDDIDVAVRHGELLGVIGPNGSGRTTLADCLCGLRSLDGGTMTLDRHDITHASPRQIVRHGLGRTFQVSRLHGQLTVTDHLELSITGTQGFRWPRAPEHAGRIGRLLARLELTEVATVVAEELSVGQQRLLEVGMALAAEPKVLVLDEIAAGATPATVSRIKALVRACAAEGTAVLVIEHDVGVVADLCHRVMVLNRGQVVAEGSPAAVIGSEATEAAYLGAEGG